MKTINIVFSSSNTFGSKFLQWVQRCEHSHIEVDFGDYVIGARALSTGVAKYREFKGFKHRKFSMIQVTDEQYEKFYAFMHGCVGHKYDWRAYLGFVLFRTEHSTNKWFCSELVQDALLAADVKVVVNTPSYYCVPRDFWISPLLTRDPYRDSIY